LTIKIFFRNLVYGDLFIAFCAVMMAWETVRVFGQPDGPILLFIFFSTLCSYSFHSLVNTIYPAATYRHEWNIKNKPVLITTFILSSLLVFVYTWKLRNGILFIAIGGVATFLYSAPNIPFKPFIFLRRIAIGKTIFLAGVWTYVTGMMPMLMSSKGMTARHYFFLGSRLFLVYAICILFDLKDRTEDRKKGIRALPTVLSGKSIRFIYYLSLVFSLASSIMMYRSGIDLSVFIFMLVPVLFCIFIYNGAIKRKDDLFYYVILDGMMMMSALLLFVYVFSITFVS
jgi:4-hydroxybenzoate polyprenyltransferase